MVDVRFEPYVGLIADGHDLDPDEMLTAVGVAVADHTDLKALERRRILPPALLPIEAWWGGPDLGFVQEDHPLARPVTVVHLPEDVSIQAHANAAAKAAP